jgi:D-alanyl-D-alanine carboxypeptidase
MVDATLALSTCSRFWGGSMPARRTLLRGSAAAVLATAVGSGTATRASAAPADGPDRRALQGDLDQMVATGAIAALARLETASGVWAGASGLAELGRTRPAPVDGRFRVGSITKTFVATVVLQLVAERRINLDDSVERWLPGAIPNSAGITVRQLLQHTSGIFDYTNILLDSVPDYLRIRFQTFTPRELVALAAAQPPLFDPGTSWSYSNTNYILLGLIIEQVTGRRYGAEVARRILRPLALHQTEVPGTAPNIPGPHPHGYVPVQQNGQTVPLDITLINPSAAWSAGEIISTTTDLNRFYRAQLRGRLLPAAQLRDMLTPTGPIDYGLGIFRVVLAPGVTLWGHDGSIPGYIGVAFSTEDGLSQLSVAVTPWLDDFNPALTNLLFTAFGVPAPATASAAMPMRLPMLDRLPR